MLSKSTPQSKKLFYAASQFIPGGVNSPVRAFRSVGGEPLFISHAKGSRLWDADQNEYIDFVGSWGPAILGHAHPEVVAAITQAVTRGISFGAPTELETQLAKAVIESVPSIEMIRFVSSGTEACMSVLRVARAFTERSKIIKFEGCYHGHGDMLLVKAGSGAATMGVPDSPGVPTGTAADTLTVAYNDLGAVAALFEKHPDSIAALIIEPIVGNSGFIRPLPGFLEGLSSLCKKFGALLIFDEVMTGFRVGLGGVQALHGITPDLTCLGKVIGGGMPLAAYGGRKDIMAKVAPSGPVYQAGTLSGNPVAVTCGLKTLELVRSPQFFKTLAERTTALVEGFRKSAAKNNIPFYADSEGGMFGFFFQKGPVRSFADAKNSNLEQFKRFFWGMLDGGIYLAPSAYEAGFVSSAHTDLDIEQTLRVAENVMKVIEVMGQIGVSLGWIPYLNLVPMYQELQRMTSGQINLMSGHPTVVNRWMCEGVVTLAPCSSINLLKTSQIEMALPLGVASEGPVHSVYIGLRREHLGLLDQIAQRQRLFRQAFTEAQVRHRGDWKQIAKFIHQLAAKPQINGFSEPAKVVFTSASAASVGLAKFFLKIWFGLNEAELMFAKHEDFLTGGERPMELVIGDEALVRRSEFAQVLDLGQMWWDVTALPFVFAVWQTTVSEISSGVKALLMKAAELSSARMRVEASTYTPDPAPTDSQGHPIDLKAYWQSIQYKLSRRHMDGLLLYLTLCTAFLDTPLPTVTPARLVKWSGTWSQLVEH